MEIDGPVKWGDGRSRSIYRNGSTSGHQVRVADPTRAGGPPVAAWTRFRIRRSFPEEAAAFHGRAAWRPTALSITALIKISLWFDKRPLEPLSGSDLRRTKALIAARGHICRRLGRAYGS